jgi:hypothetical protein
METKRGDIELLQHPVARQLLHATIPARVSYIALDGTPRVVAMQFLWTGDEVVLHSWPDDPKVAALRANPHAAVLIDTAESPYRVLQIRGVASISFVEGTSPDMVATSTRYMGAEAGRAWAEQAARLSPQQARIAVRPTWVDVLDFETRLPAGMERQLRRANAAG